MSTTIASEGCYSCHGTGLVDGFGNTGRKCPCVSECEDCGESVAWERDGDAAPRTCGRCVEVHS